VKKHLVLKLFVAFFAITLLAGSASAQVITRGAMLHHYLLQDLAAQFMLENPGANVLVQTGGAGASLPLLINRTADILNSPLTLNELAQTGTDPANAIADANSQGISIEEIKIGIDGIDFFVHPSNPVTSLTLGQLRAIFRGDITNWNEVGGNNHAITVYWPGHHIVDLPRRNSAGATPPGTDHKGFVIEEWFMSFNEMLGTGSFFPGFTFPGHVYEPALHQNQIFGAVANNPHGIGYDSIFFVNRDLRGPGPLVRSLTIIGPDEAEDSVRGDEFSRKYPVARHLLMLIRGGDTSQEALDFLDFIRSPAGQRIIGRAVMPILPPARTFEIAIIPAGSPELEQTISFQENVSNRMNFVVNMHGETEFIVFARNNTSHDGTFPTLRTANGAIENRGLFVVHRDNDPEHFHGLASNNITELRLSNIAHGDAMWFIYNGQRINVAFGSSSSSGGCSTAGFALTAALLLLPIVFRKKRK